ncbi:MAG: CapA family protein [Clostridiales bacterium]|nr:CapA family protein [Clostridiales bacterium]
MKKAKASSVFITILCIALCVVGIFIIRGIPNSDPLSGENGGAVKSLFKTTSADVSETEDAEAASELIDKLLKKDESFSEETLEYCAAEYGTETLEKVLKAMDDESYTAETWHKLTGNSLNVLNDIASGDIKSDKHIHVLESTSEDGEIKLGFAGDINLADDWAVMQQYRKTNNISDCVSTETLELIKGMDVMCANNEFVYTTSDEKAKNKSYTFKSDPANVFVMEELGVDVVSLANNHINDYGETGVNDTVETLNKAGIGHVGAGKNLKEASQAEYYIINGRKIAYVAGADAYAWYRVPAASENGYGIIPAEVGSEDALVDAVKEAASKSDYVMVMVHWGYEKVKWYDKPMTDRAHKFIDAGASAVIGAHPHVLTGMEIYNDSLIAYSLGNFWFNAKNIDSGIVEIIVDKDGKMTNVFHPCVTSGATTSLVTDPAAKEKGYYFIESHSTGWCTSLDENGVITPSKK